MKTSLVITTINKPNKNINKCVKKTKEKKWEFIIVGDKKTPKNFKINYGTFYSIKDQKKLNFFFSKICPLNSYARKNIGYLLAIKNNNEVIIETDDDNFPYDNFFSEKSLFHHAKKILNKSWVNIYDLFLHKKSNHLIWPRGLPLSDIDRYKIKLGKSEKNSFYLQQGVCEKNPDVDAIYRLLNKNININFNRDVKFDLGRSINTFNSQNTIWFKKIFPLLYLPVTCTMRCTDIWRSLVALKILYNDSKKILFFGTTMAQMRNQHNLMHDFCEEIPMYKHNNEIFFLLSKLNLKKGEGYYLENLLKCYKLLISHGIINKNELYFLNAWVKDIKKILK
jgi:hypothetical protein